MKEELDIIERLEMNPKVLEKLKTIEDIRLYLENGIFNMTKFLDDNNIKKYNLSPKFYCQNKYLFLYIFILINNVKIC